MIACQEEGRKIPTSRRIPLSSQCFPTLNRVIHSTVVYSDLQWFIMLRISKRIPLSSQCFPTLNRVYSSLQWFTVIYNAPNFKEYPAVFPMFSFSESGSSLQWFTVVYSNLQLFKVAYSVLWNINIQVQREGTCWFTQYFLILNTTWKGELINLR